MTEGLVSDYLVTTAGDVFVVSDRSGDIEPRSLQGLYAEDTRFLSALRVTIDGREPLPLGCAVLDHDLASFYSYGSSSGTQTLDADAVSVVRDRHVAHGLHEDISVINHSSRPKRFQLTLSFHSDFADLFEVRLGTVRKKGETAIGELDGGMRLEYHRDGFRRETLIGFSTQPEIKGRTASFRLELQSRESWRLCVDVLPVLNGRPEPMKCVASALGAPFGAYQRTGSQPILPQRTSEAQPLSEVPTLETDHAGLLRAYSQAVTDLRSLRMEQKDGHYILAAGLPWFMAVFGRDSIITALQTKLLGPELMLGTLMTLADLQATTEDPFRDSQPGKIPHEARRGELSVLEEVPHSRYYGSVDATPLFLILLWEAYQWTGDIEIVRRLLPAAKAALRMIDEHGDLDGDGFIEYQRKTRKGLRNQCWKDSHDSISFAGGTLARTPIAVAEVQGYVYDAKNKMAELYRLLGEETDALKLEASAKRLAENFNDAFWMPEEGFYAIALDARNRRVDSIASNAGHCLWSGIVPGDRAARVVERLMAPDMFSGWGVRTLSTDMARYNPVSYHNGSVWPHDNSIIAAGMRRYGFTEQADRIVFSMLDAAEASSVYRLPELFAGYPRREMSFPVPYPAANSPQAWATGAIIHYLETLLGVVPERGHLMRQARRDGIFLSLKGVRYRGASWYL